MGYVGEAQDVPDEERYAMKYIVKALKKLPRKFRETGLTEVIEKADLEALIKIPLRDYFAGAVLCFLEYELIIMPGETSFVTYFNDLSKFETVKAIVASEGLFLRPCENYMTNAECMEMLEMEEE